MMYPLFFAPIFKDKMWGGDKLKTLLDKAIDSETIGESWEIAAHPNGMSTVTNGPLKGKTLETLIKEYGKAVMGSRMGNVEKFPLLLKVIDAKDMLSVQVHPEDDYANVHENGEYGKNEAWYILDAEEGATLVAGLKEGTTKEEFKKALDDGQLETVLNEIEVKAGDVINIPAGFVHAIGKGIVIAEIQQNSDTTYRVYDWMRADADGNYRELHVDKAMDVIDFEGKIPTEILQAQMEEYGGCMKKSYIDNNYFTLDALEIHSHYSVFNKVDNFELYFCVEGEGKILWENESHTILKGESFMIPAAMKNYRIEGDLTVLKMSNRSYLNEEMKRKSDYKAVI